MTGHHLRSAALDAFECYYGVQEYGRLGYEGLLQLLLGTRKHDIGDSESEDLICLFK